MRPLLVLLAVPNLVTGLWAIVDPQGWFDDFPSWSRRLVSAFPPYNEHLAGDAGGGLLAIGVLAALAASEDAVNTASLWIAVVLASAGLSVTIRVPALGPDPTPGKRR